MAHKNQNRVDAGWQSENDVLGRELNAALAKYADVEPRAGLETRVLANMQTERARVSDPAWWRWSCATALAAVIVVAFALAWRSGKPSHPVVANHPSTATQSTKEPATHAASNREENEVRPTRPTLSHKVAAQRSDSPVMASAQPKLDHFPSPQPPSQQELALRRYVSQFPQEATLIARAQEEYEKEIQQQMKDARSQTENDTSDQQER
jgi:hypothetical protein